MVSLSSTGSSLLTLRTRSPRRGGKTRKQKNPGDTEGDPYRNPRPRGVKPQQEQSQC
jgi:hypothetical protein